MTYFLGVDIGTGSTKAVAINETADEVLSVEQSSYSTFNAAPLYSEQDPEKIWEAFVQCVNATVRKLGRAPEAIGFSTAMHSVIPVDAQGMPVAPMMTWADGRSAEIARNLRAAPGARQLYEATGTPIHAMSPLCKIMWLRTHSPDVFTSAVRFISIKEFIWYRLFNSYQMDYSAASGSGLMDIMEKKWHQPSLDLAGIQVKNLSELVPTDYTRGDLPDNMRKKLSLPPSTLFVIGGGDGCLANLGSNAVSEGVACLTIGTSGAVRVASVTPCHDFESMTFNYILDNKTFICGGPVNNGGAILKWYVHEFLRKGSYNADDFDEFLAQAANIPAGSEGLIFLPYLMGERAPIWDSRISGAFFGITVRHTQDHFTRSVIEGISYALYQVAGSLQQASGKINMINASGGFVRSREWLQLLSDIFDTTICRNNAEDASSIGAALIAIRASRNLDAYPVFRDREQAERFTPDASNHARYVKSFEIFKRLFQKTRDEMEIIHKLNTAS